MISPYEHVLQEARLPDELKSYMPKRWELLGDVILLKIPNSLIPWKDEVGRAYATVLGAKTALWDKGIAGPYRTPVVEILYGRDTETIHRENGIVYKLDAAKIMFSSGNIHERMRMASVADTNEVVVDMFSGIGYFTLPLAVHCGCRVKAYEINPVAYRYLVENVRLNCVEGLVETHLDDCQNAPEGIADRVIMGYLGVTHHYLDKAIAILKDGGGIIHYHETCPVELLPHRPFRRIIWAVERSRREIVNMSLREVKSYAPGVDHVVVDLHVR